MSVNFHPASFRDPSGFIFTQNEKPYRAVCEPYKQELNHLISSGLLRELTEKGLLVAHEQVETPPGLPENVCATWAPAIVPVVSYPYEWCFGQLKAAASLTLKIMKKAIAKGMVLKDASAYNVQFFGSAPRFIDLLSFERREVGAPWVAYRQFCQHFLAPLALAAKVDIRLISLLRTHLDGIPLDMASRLLPRHTWLKPGLLIHIHLHAKSQKRFSEARKKGEKETFGQNALWGLIESMDALIQGLDWNPAGTAWADYSQSHTYQESELRQKQDFVAGCVERERPGSVLDLGSNVGIFSRIASSRGAYCISADMDPASVELNYRRSVKDSEANILPLVCDIGNPSPGIGWANAERSPLLHRTHSDMALALALLHHLVIAGNIPMDMVRDLLASVAKVLVIEFVPKEDTQTQRLLRFRRDIFPEYTQSGFEASFGRHFRIMDSRKISGTGRIIYLMRRKG